MEGMKERVRNSVAKSGGGEGPQKGKTKGKARGQEGVGEPSGTALSGRRREPLKDLEQVSGMIGSVF